MLKSLFKKLKSEKSDSLSYKAEKETDSKSDNLQIKQPQALYQYRQLQEQTKVFCEISSIRYSVYSQSPDLCNKIIACPISHFNQLPYAKRKVKQIDLKTHPCPQYINSLNSILHKQLPQFNHLLINVYPPGVGIMPHFDGPLYKPKVIVLSLGGPAIINFQQSYGGSSKITSILLQDKSLHIFQGQAYEKCLHGISDYVIDSIFLNLAWSQQFHKYQIKQCSISNFLLTRLFKILQKVILDKMLSLATFQEIDLSKDCGYICCFIPIEQNKTYNCKLEIVRKERISITIRHKFDQKGIQTLECKKVS